MDPFDRYSADARSVRPGRCGDMENLVISPAETSAKVGDTIKLINKDVFAHTATARNGDFDVTMPPNKTMTLVLKKAGTVDYYCRFHPNMKATLVVEP
jgi:plastocyanin